jgi:methyl-accepting chemotaxis protein
MLSFLLNLKTSRKLAAAFLLMILVSLAASAVIWRNLATLAQNNQWTVHTYQVMDPRLQGSSARGCGSLCI